MPKHPNKHKEYNLDNLYSSFFILSCCLCTDSEHSIKLPMIKYDVMKMSISIYFKCSPPHTPYPELTPGVTEFKGDCRSRDSYLISHTFKCLLFSDESWLIKRQT